MNATQENRLSLGRDPREARTARRHVTAACAGLDDDVVEVAELLTSELVTNALQHGVGDISVAVKRTPAELHVEVSDSGRGSPRAGMTDHERTGGRGLQLVDALAATWGVRSAAEAGKTVWFKLRTAVPTEGLLSS